MKFELVKIEEFSNVNVSVFTLVDIETNLSLVDVFIQENSLKYNGELKDIFTRINSFKEVGARENYFKHHEGLPGDGICALYDKPNSNLRLYCIRYGTSLIILGGGGYKSKNTRALQETPKLLQENGLLRNLSSEIERRRREGDLIFTNDFLDIEGDLQFEL